MIYEQHNDLYKNKDDFDLFSSNDKIPLDSFESSIKTELKDKKYKNEDFFNE